MQPATINPNLTTYQTFSYKDILIKKLVRAMAWSVVSQIVILLIYIIVVNANIFHPSKWISAILNTFTYLSTWIFVIIFLLIIFAQCLICAKNYVLMTVYCSTRFQYFCHVFSFHYFILLLLHVVTGGAFVWQILAIIDSSNEYSATKCQSNNNFLFEDFFFLIVGGFWTGFYFFTKVYISTKKLVFPVIHQRKFLIFRSNLFSLFKQSLVMAMWLTFYFVFFYYIWGNQLESQFSSFFNVKRAAGNTNISMYVYSWWFSTLYCFSNNLMRFFFQLYLTEPVQFPLVKENIYVLTLQEAINMSNLPIIQKLACLDLFLLSQWSPIRRQLLFTLSQPGGRPRNLNFLTENVLKLFTDYTIFLKKTIEQPIQEMLMKRNEVITPFPPMEPQPLELDNTQNFQIRNLRNVFIINNSDFYQVDVSENVSSGTLGCLKAAVDERLTKIFSSLKILFGINFLFEELPEVNIQKCLEDGQLIIWASQGIAKLAAASLVEDKYGIVQKDLPVLITGLVQLKQALDKFNGVPSLSQKIATLDNFYYGMKNAINAAVNRSLLNICIHFGRYFNDIQLSNDVVRYLQLNIMLNNSN